MRRVEFDAAFTFLYSPRSGTPAAEMKEQLPAEVKKERLRRLMDLQNEISLRSNQKLLGKVVEVLVEGESKTNEDKLTGRTRTNELAVFPGPKNLEGKLVPVRIVEAGTWTLTGELISFEA